ncbi:TPA: host cell division inhibitor Icd-like protein [Salmonella enterica subsp. enterica serovar Stanley]|nr:host cell division inhibitor Icd-like protein [Salmonella enterica]HEC8290729.1 host cell division inhibitor Icd-like protein [Salmonella enterica subsp. enterica serovar Stanley]
MATTLNPTYPQYTWLFLAVRRCDLRDKPHRRQVTAPDYPTARRLIARDYVAAFAGRIPCRTPAGGDDNAGNGYSPAYTFAP